jgi:hypothetical protein
MANAAPINATQINVLVKLFTNSLYCCAEPLAPRIACA